MLKKILDNKILCILSMIISIVFTFWYMHFSNPLYYYGALSVIGLSHPVLFKIWGAFTEAAMIYNIIQMYYKYHYNNNWAKGLLFLGLTSIIITVNVPYVFDNTFKYITHCYGAVSFIIYNAAAMLIIFIKHYKKSKGFKAMTIITFSILIIVLTLFIIIGESGILEVTPMILSFIIMLLINFTDICKIEEIKAKEKELIKV